MKVSPELTKLYTKAKNKGFITIGEITDFFLNYPSQNKIADEAINYLQKELRVDIILVKQEKSKKVENIKTKSRLEKTLNREIEENGHIKNRDIVRIYLNDVKKFSSLPLTYNLEIELAKKISQGDLQAREEFICAHLSLVTLYLKYFNRYYSPHLDYLDFVQEGNIGLIDAVDKFDYKKGYKFKTYALFRIRGAVFDAIRKENSNDGQLRAVENVSKFLKDFFQQKGREPTMIEIAKATRLSSKKIKEVFWLMRIKIINISDFSLGEDNFEEETLIKGLDLTPEQILELKEQLDEDLDIIRRICQIIKSTMTKKALQLFCDIFGISDSLYEKKKQIDIALKSNRKSTTIRSNLRRIFEKLRILDYDQITVENLINRINEIARILNVELLNILEELEK